MVGHSIDGEDFLRFKYLNDTSSSSVRKNLKIYSKPKNNIIETHLIRIVDIKIDNVLQSNKLTDTEVVIINILLNSYTTG